MKTLTKAALAATVATGLFAAPAFAAPNTDSADFTARAKIVKAVTIAKNSNLNFGTITMLNTLTAETVKVGQTAAGNSCGTGVGVTCSFPTQAAATFTVTGVPTQALAVVVSGDTVLTDATGNTVPFSPDAPVSVTVAAGGSVDFAIGGEIDIVPATKDGLYTGNLTVTVTYQ